MLQAVENVISIGKNYPLKTRPDEVLNYECYCLPSNYSRVPEQFNWTAVDKESCQVIVKNFRYNSKASFENILAI